MTSAPSLIAIVGRPNVGKSTLFNRLAGRRRALVADIPGVTRDRIAEEIVVAGRRILLVDTAGLDAEAASAAGGSGERELSAAVQQQARGALEDADAILFVVDGQSGLLPEDEEIARTLRRSKGPLTLVVNKIDVPAHASREAEFHRLGFERVRGCSAEHGSGAFDALEELVALLPAAAPEDDTAARGEARVALVGRPNVGKSSLVNRLAGEDRVVVSEVAGTTRDSIDIRIELEPAGDAAPGQGVQTLVLVDTAGLRRAGRRTRVAERGSALMTVRALERAEVALLVIDAGEGMTDQDSRIASLVVERGCALVVLANKWDLVAAERREEVLEAIQHGLRFVSHAPVLTVSAKTGAKLDRVWPAVRQVAEMAHRRIPTADLNRWLRETVAKHEPSMARRGPRRRPIKFFYATQAAQQPPTFVLFCTEPSAVLPSYRRFLENQLREAFGFEGTPVRLRLRARRERSGRR